ncbi:hypothetical protein, partial [Xanthomonas euvesicatoria]|uniref:hypothetical protein n=1 Tax=Xanthomonas euvesicatoria TaxID=456327 RepID=UPI0019D2CF18
RVGLFDKPDDLLGAESALLHVRPLGFTDFIASAGTAQWGQVTGSPPFSRTLTRRPIKAMRSVHVKAQEVHCRVQAWRG